MDNFSKIDYNRIVDYLSERLDFDSKRDFEKWLHESELNQQLFNKVKSYWEATIPVNFDSASVHWQKLIKELKDRKEIGFRSRMIAFSLAACLLVLVSWVWIFNRFENASISYSSSPDSFRKDTLSDGSIVYLYPSSSIKMEPEKMKITLTGEAYFVVTPHGLKCITINAGGASIIVKGTSFRVNTEAKEGFTLVEVESGAVELWSDKKNYAPLLVSAGEQAFYSAMNNTSWKMPKEKAIYLIYQPNQIR